MRLRNIALGCALAGALGCLALPPASARAENGAPGQATLTRPELTISAPAIDNPYGARVRFTVTLGPTSGDRTVSLYASPYGEARAFVAAGDVSAMGTWHPTYLMTRKTTFTVFFAGDSHDNASSAHITLRAYAGVTNRITGFFKKAKIAGRGYDVYHGTGTLTLYSTVRPAKHGECLEPETQQYDPKAGWDADTKYGCDKLDAAGHDTAPFNLKQAVGDRYRIRGDYFRGPKDLGNLNQQGAWLYFEVVR